jgi:sterol desaturase/sphingolipid hydroxylase (fatty acid hydroxylase superfamily)
MPDLPNPVDFAVPVFIALILIEMIWAKRRAPEKYEPRDTLTSLMFGFGNSIIAALTGAAMVALFVKLSAFRIATVPYTWWAWALCFILDDLFYYGFHRSAHRVRWFWASHVNHHSSQHYNLSTALRQTWTGNFALSFMFDVPLILFGFPPAMLFFVSGLNLIYQFWIHTEAIQRMPRWFEAVMNTPSHHRVHHAVNPRYLDRNYAGVFIIWDRLFGTFEPEVDTEVIRYGIVKQLGGFNLLWSVFHEWAEMAGDVLRAPSSAKLGYLVRPPGWSHDGTRDTSDSIRARWRQGLEEPSG